MRLIDADKLIEQLEKVKEECSSLVDISHIVGFQAAIDIQPTVYDTDKVVEQLENLKTINVDIGFGTLANTLRKEVVLDIVKGGGVDA